MRLRMSQLLLLRELGEQRNLRRAAAALGVAQPVATRQIREFEQALGVLLFERSRKGMVPTAYGDTMIRQATLALSDLEAAEIEIDALASGAAGSISVGATTSIAPILLPRALARVRREHPRLRIAVREGDQQRLVADLARGELDLALLRQAPDSGLSGLRYEVLYSEGFCIVASRHHPMARASRLSLSDLAGEAWILPPESVPLRQQLDLVFLSGAGRRPANPIESVSILTNQALLQQAPLLAVLPESVARQSARQRLLSILPVRLTGLTGPVALVTRAPADPSPAMESFVASLRTEALALRARPHRSAQTAAAPAVA